MASSIKRMDSMPTLPKDGIGVLFLQQNFRAGDILGQGYLTKIGQRWKSHKRRWFVITFQDVKYYESRDKYEANASPLGMILVSDIQSIQQSNALGFGANTSLSIRTGSRVLEVGDQKELVADSIFFVLQRWLALRDRRNDHHMITELSIPVVEMPNVLQRDVVRQFQIFEVERCADLMQEPPFLYSWTETSRARVLAEYMATFEKVFQADASKSSDNLKKYILLHDIWTPEIVIHLVNSGKIRRLLLDPAPCLHYLADHFASITKADFTWFDVIQGIPTIIECLKRLRTDYHYILPELVIPTHLAQPDEVTALINLFKEALPGIQFDAPSTKASCKYLQPDGTYILHLYSNPSPNDLPVIHNALTEFMTLPSRLSTGLLSDHKIGSARLQSSPPSDNEEQSIPSSLQTIDSGSIMSLSSLMAASKAAASAQVALDKSPQTIAATVNNPSNGASDKESHVALENNSSDQTKSAQVEPSS